MTWPKLSTSAIILHCSTASIKCQSRWSRIQPSKRGLGAWSSYWNQNKWVCMGFWFQKRASKAPSKPAGAFLSGGPPGKARQNATTLARLGCRGCPLDKAPCQTPKMAPTLAMGSSVYILAEAPGQNEDEVSHKPLTGPSGKLLHECIPEGERASFDNVLNCRPPDNRTPTWQEIECCRPRRVKWIEEAKPKLILGLGAVPLKFMLGSTDLKGMRGRLFAVRVGTHECWFLPTYHPAFLLHLPRKSKS